MRFSINNKPLRYILIALLVVFAVFMFYHWYAKHHRQQTLPIYTVQRGDISSRATAPGTIVPIRQTIITAPFSGYVQKIYVQTGQHVKAGEALVTVVQSLQSHEVAYPIRAPYAGLVTLVNKSEGEFVVQADPTTGFILKIDDLSRLYVMLDVAERDIAQVKLGQAVSIRPASSNQTVYHGIVVNVARAPKPQTSTGFFGQVQVVFSVKVLINKPDLNKLYSGMSVLSDILLAHRKNVVLIPHEYVHVTNDNQYYVVLANGKKRMVKLGLENPRMVEIRKGLAVGDKVRQIDYFSLGK